MIVRYQDLFGSLLYKQVEATSGSKLYFRILVSEYRGARTCSFMGIHLIILKLVQVKKKAFD